MNIISPAFKIITPIDGIEILKTLEEVGRTCYKSEDKITDDSCNKFVQNIIDRGHEAVIEHYNAYIKIDRKQFNLGLFDTPERANQERIEFESKLMYCLSRNCKGA